jgi:hypothetical protein
MTQNFFGRLYRDHPVYLEKLYVVDESYYQLK